MWPEMPSLPLSDLVTSDWVSIYSAPCNEDCTHRRKSTAHTFYITRTTTVPSGEKAMRVRTARCSGRPTMKRFNDWLRYVRKPLGIPNIDHDFSDKVIRLFQGQSVCASLDHVLSRVRRVLHATIADVGAGEQRRGRRRRHAILRAVRPASQGCQSGHRLSRRIECDFQ